MVGYGARFALSLFEQKNKVLIYISVTVHATEAEKLNMTRAKNPHATQVKNPHVTITVLRCQSPTFFL